MFKLSGLGLDVFFFVWTCGSFFFFDFKAYRLTLSGLSFHGFFFFLTRGSFFYVTAFGLRVSGLGYDVVYLFYDLSLLFLCYSVWFKGVGFRF